MTPQKVGLRGELVPVTLRMPRHLRDLIHKETKLCPDGKKKIGLWINDACAKKLGSSLEEVDARNAEVYPDA